MERKELLLKQEFFKNKKALVDIIINKEKNNEISLPNKFSYKQTAQVELNGTYVSLLRIENFYALELTKEDETKYQLFNNEIELRKFFINNSIDAEVDKFWLRLMELICD